ncbi:MAG: hypothetical protein M3R51_05680 [Candidatus Eremiobacteraeota bacterium]|nr:hypothetical protein [Candidatus Eremiobacteraeota bacterium]
MTTTEHLTEMKHQCQEAARSFQELMDSADEETDTQDQFNASVLKALRHAHDAIESLIS